MSGKPKTRSQRKTEQRKGTLDEHFSAQKRSGKSSEKGRKDATSGQEKDARSSDVVTISQEESARKKENVAPRLEQEEVVEEEKEHLRYQDFRLPPQGIRGPIVPAGEPFDQEKWKEETHHDFSGESLEVRKLREFDVDTRFGPTSGVTRMERWHRAQRLGMDPPEEILHIMKGSA